MKHIRAAVVLAAWSALCLWAGCAEKSGLALATLEFPFVPLGKALRALSLSGGTGNAAAWALYALISLSPLAALPYWRRGGLHAEDWLLPVLSAALFRGLYLLVNPGLMQAFQPVLLNGALVCLLVSHLLLRFTRTCCRGGAARQFALARLLLWLFALLCTWSAFGASFGELAAEWSALPDGLNRLCAVVRTLAAAVPYLADVAVVFAAQDLLTALARDRYDSAAVSASDRLSRRAVRALALTVCAQLASNLLQLLCSGQLTDVRVATDIPLGSVGFMLSALLLSRLLADGKRLKDDHDLIV